jgi:hypothetical protein
VIPFPELVQRRQIHQEDMCMFDDDSKIEWFDKTEEPFVFACSGCDWGGTRPIAVGFEDEDFGRWVAMYCPVCGLEVDPGLTN